MRPVLFLAPSSDEAIASTGIRRARHAHEVEIFGIGAPAMLLSVPLLDLQRKWSPTVPADDDVPVHRPRH